MEYESQLILSIFVMAQPMSDTTKRESCGWEGRLLPSCSTRPSSDDHCRGGSVRQPRPIMPKGRFALQNNKKKSVQFSLMSELYIFEDSPTSTKKWYTVKDYHGFKRDLKRDLQFMRRRLHDVSTTHTISTTVAEPYYCPVGIEQASSVQDVVNADRCKTISIRSVLLAQSRQRMMGYHDPEQIASLYGSLATESRERAHKRGKFQDLVKLV